MKKKEIKKTKLKPRKKAEMKRDQLVVILEDMRYQFSVMKDGFLGVNKRFDNLDKKIDNNHKEFKELRSVMIDFKNEMTDFKDEMTDFKNGTNSNFKANFEYLSKIDDEIQSIKKEMAEIKEDIVNGERIDPVKFFEIERRVKIVEKKLNINPQLKLDRI